MKPSGRPGQPLVLVLIIFGLLALALGGYFEPIAGLITQPFIESQQWVTVRYQAFRDIVAAPEEITNLRQRNQLLETELANLRTQIIALEQQVLEVEILEALLDFARAQPQNEYLAASIIARDPSPFLKYVIINRGSDDGLRWGMPIVSSEGLIGRISAVMANAARVQLITDSLSNVNVQVEPSEVDAVLQGSVTGDLILGFIPQDANIQPGDFLLTSGLGGNFPSDILIGQVVSVRNEPTELFQQASIQSAVDFTRLEIVLVIINFDPIDIGPLLPSEETP